MHRICVHLCEESRWLCDDGGNEKLCGLRGLTDVTRSKEPMNVGIHLRPPETFRNYRTSCVKSFMAYRVVAIAHYQKSSVRKNDEFVCAVSIFAPKFIVVYEEVRRVSYELDILVVRKV